MPSLSAAGRHVPELPLEFVLTRIPVRNHPCSPTPTLTRPVLCSTKQTVSSACQGWWGAHTGANKEALLPKTFFPIGLTRSPVAFVWSHQMCQAPTGTRSSWEYPSLTCSPQPSPQDVGLGACCCSDCWGAAHPGRASSSPQNTPAAWALTWPSSLAWERHWPHLQRASACASAN